jgi:ribosomal protein S18 acetylase RimI-like enzyme
VVGGLIGKTLWGWLEIANLWVDSHLRGLGFGTKLMQAAELEAISRNCHAVMLDTFSFQALDFYHKLDYVIFGKLDNFPHGNIRYFLRKSLSKMSKIKAFQVGSATFGDGRLTIIAGPCVVETQEHALFMARELKQ